MVGLVLVSHSRALAEALIALVKQVGSQDIPVVAAAGVGPECQEFGTDAVAIGEAIQSVYSAEGVLVLMDLGSAILSAEMALEFLPEDMQPNIHFCAAPLVEGAISAGVQIGLGSQIGDVVQEAKRALAPKIEQLQYDDELDATVQSHPPLKEGVSTESHEITVTVTTPHGLHARPAARFVKTAAQFDADIQVYKLSEAEPSSYSSVPATSLSSLMTLGVLQNDRIGIRAAGKHAEQALEALRYLAEERFGEKKREEPTASDVPPRHPIHQKEQKIIPLSAGIAYGPSFSYQETRLHVTKQTTEHPEHEWEHLQETLQTVRQTINQRHQTVQATLGISDAEIFEAHLYILDDRVLLERVRSFIFNENLTASAAWHTSIQEITDSYRKLSDPYLKERAKDVLDVGNQVLLQLHDRNEITAPSLPEPGILIVQELTPTFVSQLDPQQVLGLIALQGGPTDHSSILARSLGIPAIAVPSLSEIFQDRDPSFTLSSLPKISTAIDAFQGEFWIEPSQELLSQLQQQKSAWQTRRQHDMLACHKPAVTLDGHRIAVVANAGSCLDAEIAVRNGAEGIGVLRTEFLYVDRESAPTEDEQVDTLIQIGKVLKGRPVYARTLDIGGDKFVPYLQLPHEANPFLGVRSIRLSLRSPDLFNTQLRAILRAGADADVRIMFPMISRVEELIQARRSLEDVHAALEQERIPHRWPIEVAMMVETPAAALLTASCAQYVDYFSIGTNDLTQYTLAAERGNPELVDYADGLHSAVLYLIRHVVEAAHHCGKHVGVCGELASDPAAMPILVGLGVDELSLNPIGIPEAKTTIRKISREQAAKLSSNALQCSATADIRKMTNTFLGL